VSPKLSVVQDLAGSVCPIILPGADIDLVAEILTAMLVALITGSDLRSVF
jgi:hypothetical protein